MAKRLKKYRKNQNLSISYQAVVIDFNWRLHHNNHNPSKKISTNTEKSHEWPACAKPKPPFPQQTPSLPTTSHLHLGPRRRASAHDICRLTSSLPSLRNRDMPLTEPWRWVDPPVFGRVCMWKGWDKVTFLLLTMGVWEIEMGVVPVLGMTQVKACQLKQQS